MIMPTISLCVCLPIAMTAAGGACHLLVHSIDVRVQTLILKQAAGRKRSCGNINNYVDPQRRCSQKQETSQIVDTKARLPITPTYRGSRK